jgi:hypothetical protein
MMAMINTKAVHRSNQLLNYAYGRDFVYDEMMMTGSGPAPIFSRRYRARQGRHGQPRHGHGHNRLWTIASLNSQSSI